MRPSCDDLRRESSVESHTGRLRCNQLVASAPPADMAPTLVHELAHAVTDAAMDRTGRQVVAGSVVPAVCSRLGLDMALRSVDYVALWLDDSEAFRAGMAAIHHGASALIDAIKWAMLEIDEFQLAA